MNTEDWAIYEQVQERIAGVQGIDGVIMMLIISRMLRRRDHPQPGTYHGKWIDVDAVAQRIWPDPRDPQARVDDYLRILRWIGAYAHTPIMTATGLTVIDSSSSPAQADLVEPIWWMSKKMTRAGKSIPLSVELVGGDSWTRIISSGMLRLHFKVARLLAEIPADMPSGAMARIMAIGLANIWAKHPSDALSSASSPTRAEVLMIGSAAGSAAKSILRVVDHTEAAQVWHEAVHDLVSLGIIAERAGDDAETVAQGHDGGQAWLDEHIDMLPGERVAEEIRACAG